MAPAGCFALQADQHAVSASSVQHRMVIAGLVSAGRRLPIGGCASLPESAVLVFCVLAASKSAVLWLADAHSRHACLCNKAQLQLQ
jgi:hypothetical protein